MSRNYLTILKAYDKATTNSSMCSHEMVSIKMSKKINQSIWTICDTLLQFPTKLLLKGERCKRPGDVCPSLQAEIVKSGWLQFTQDQVTKRNQTQ